MNAGQSRRTSGEQLLSASRAVFALGLLVRPDRLARRVTFGAPLPPRWVIRLLGARMLVQSGLELASTSLPAVELGVAVDAAHAASMLAIASRSARYRRVTLTSAATAGTSAIIGLFTVRRRRSVSGR